MKDGAPNPFVKPGENGNLRGGARTGFRQTAAPSRPPRCRVGKPRPAGSPRVPLHRCEESTTVILFPDPPILPRLRGLMRRLFLYAGSNHPATARRLLELFFSSPPVLSGFPQSQDQRFLQRSPVRAPQTRLNKFRFSVIPTSIAIPGGNSGEIGFTASARPIMAIRSFEGGAFRSPEPVVALSYTSKRTPIISSAKLQYQIGLVIPRRNGVLGLCLSEALTHHNPPPLSSFVLVSFRSNRIDITLGPPPYFQLTAQTFQSLLGAARPWRRRHPGAIHRPGVCDPGEKARKKQNSYSLLYSSPIHNTDSLYHTTIPSINRRIAFPPCLRALTAT